MNRTFRGRNYVIKAMTSYTRTDLVNGVNQLSCHDRAHGPEVHEARVIEVVDGELHQARGDDQLFPGVEVFGHKAVHRVHPLGTPIVVRLGQAPGPVLLEELVEAQEVAEVVASNVQLQKIHSGLISSH